MTQAHDGDAQERQELMRHSAREFAEQHCSLTRLLEIEKAGGADPDIWRSLAEMQWTGILIPEAYGGVGGNVRDAAILYEEMGRQLVPGPHHSSTVLAALILQEGGSEEQKHLYLPAIATGDQVFVPAIAEEDDNWTADDVQLRTTPAADGYQLDGVKEYVPDAASADRLIVAACTPEGVSLFLVDANDRGVTMQRMAGWTAQPQFEVRFEGVRVSRAAAIGPIGRGWEVLQPALRAGTIVLCAYMAGAAERVWEMTIDYSHHRVQFGQSISRFQRVQDHVIDIRNHVDAAQLALQEALERLERNDPQTEKYVSFAKALASEGFYKTCEAAHHVHAGIGSVKDYGLYLYTKASHSLYHYLGSPDVHEQRVGELLAAETG